jgi:hypothetical protein
LAPALAILLAAAVFAAQRDAAAEEQLEAAIYREMVTGDLTGAMGQYEALVSQGGSGRKVAARALLQLAQCREKLGQRREAYDAYKRVTSEYADQAEVVGQARLKLAAWSGPRNLKFEEGSPGRVPPGWFVPSLPKDANYLAELRHDGCRSTIGCAVVMVPANVPRQVGNLMQSFSAAAYRGQTVRLRAWIRLEGFFVTAAGLRFPNPEDRAQMWLSVERANRRNGFSDSMDDRPVRSEEWTRCEIVSEIDADAQFINFGFMSIGGGRVWVDDVSFEIIH